MLVELGVAEQRHRAVLEVLDGAPVTVVARHRIRYQLAREGVVPVPSRSSVYRALRGGDDDQGKAKVAVAAGSHTAGYGRLRDRGPGSGHCGSPRGAAHARR